MKGEVNMYYHATKKDNVFSIIKEGLKAGIDGCVYLSDTIDGALEFMQIRGQEGMFAVIPVYLDKNEVAEGTDHNKNFFTGNSFIHEGDIPKSKIEAKLENIPLFEFHH